MLPDWISPEILDKLSKPALTIMLILAIGLWWLGAIIDDKIGLKSQATRIPDYWMEGLVARTMDAQGRLQRAITVAKVQHFADDNSIELFAPTIAQFDPIAPTWRARSQTGWLLDKGDKVILTGQVVLEREARGSINAAQLRTEKLLVQLKDQYAETNQQVHVLNGKSHVNAGAMQLWFKNPMRILLTSGVKAHYEITR
ncbi:hypothetical protein TI04_00615 [Achromatium sp. WMS2]|nr:hypothetical protein TI04_00615 [Achromatium sp. WMS2]